VFPFSIASFKPTALKFLTPPIEAKNRMKRERERVSFSLSHRRQFKNVGSCVFCCFSIFYPRRDWLWEQQRTEFDEQQTTKPWLERIILFFFQERSCVVWQVKTKRREKKEENTKKI